MDTTAQEPPPQMAALDTSTHEQPIDGTPNPGWDFFLILIGSTMGTVVIAVERARDVRFSQWYSTLLAFECIVLAVINFIVAHTFVEELFSVGEVSDLFQILRAIYTAPGGFLLWGFVLSIILLKFISFAPGEAPAKTEDKP